MKILTVNRQIVKSLGVSLIFIFIASFVAKAEITKNEVLQAQENWGNELIAVGKAYTNGKNYKKTATELVNK